MSRQTIELPQGEITYRDDGEGPVLLFSHGFLVDSELWEGLAQLLVAKGFRCVRPDSPLGSHRIPMNPGADLSPPGVAELLAGMIKALELDQVTVIGNDSGGAIAQMLAASHPDLIASLVLTNADALEVYPPWPFFWLPHLGRVPGGINALSRAMQLRLNRIVTYRMLTVDPIPDGQLKQWVEPIRRDPGIREDVRKLLVGFEKHQTIDAADRLAAMDLPVLMVWGDRDRFFKIDLAHRLAAKLRNATVVPIEGGRTFVMLDEPELVANRIAEFVSEHVVGAEQAAA